MKQEPVYLTIDSRNRVSLTKLSKKLSHLYKAYIKEDTIVLEPVREIPKEDAWLFLPENKEKLAHLKKSLKQEATHDLGSFKKYLKKK